MSQIVNNKQIGEKIQGLLSEKNLTIDDLSSQIGLRKSLVNKNLNGLGTFDYKTLIKISDILEIDHVLFFTKNYRFY